MPGERYILYIDFGEFRIAVERSINPRLHRRPVVIGNRGERQGIVAAVSAEARRYGIYPTMTVSAAWSRCPELIVIGGNHELYSRAADEICVYLRQFTPCWEFPAPGTAFLDVTGMHRLFGNAIDIGARIGRETQHRYHLTPTIGVAGNKLVSKIACGSVESAGLCDVAPGSEREFLAPLPVRRLPGVGPGVAKRLGDFNIETVGELAEAQRQFLTSTFGRRGDVLSARARGIDHSPVRTVQRPASILEEETLVRHSNDRELFGRILFCLAERGGRRLRAQRLLAGRIVVTVTYIDGRRVNGTQHPVVATDVDDEIHDDAREVFERVHTCRTAVRRIGVELSRFSPADQQLDLLDDKYRYGRKRALVSAVDRIRNIHGFDAITFGRTLFPSQSTTEPLAA